VDDRPLTTTVVVVADDLMWSSRLAEAVRRAGGTPVVLTSDTELAVALEAQDVGETPSLSAAVVDMATRRLDPVRAIERVTAARLPVIAVAQHDDQVTRRRAMAAGASRVFSYNKFFTDGTLLVERWLTASSSDPEVSPGHAATGRPA
jgi:DNA-binding NarL/FixJ family response regulator